MVCKECGKEITDETLGYCPECLAPLNEPVIVNMSKDDIKKANKNLEKKEKEILEGEAKLERLNSQSVSADQQGQVNTEIQNILNKLSLLEEDIKGIEVNKQL